MNKIEMWKCETCGKLFENKEKCFKHEQNEYKIVSIYDTFYDEDEYTPIKIKLTLINGKGTEKVVSYVIEN